MKKARRIGIILPCSDLLKLQGLARLRGLTTAGLVREYLADASELVVPLASSSGMGLQPARSSFTLRFNTDEFTHLNHIADTNGLPVVGLIRILIREILNNCGNSGGIEIEAVADETEGNIEDIFHSVSAREQLQILNSLLDSDDPDHTDLFDQLSLSAELKERITLVSKLYPRYLLLLARRARQRSQHTQANILRTEVLMAARRDRDLSLVGAAYTEMAVAANQDSQPQLGLEYADNALCFLDKARELPEVVQALLEKGAALSELGEVSRAAMAYANARLLVETGPCRLKIKVGIEEGRYLLESGEASRAKARLASLTQYPSPPAALYRYLALAHFALKDYTQAHKYMCQCIRLCKTKCQPYQKLANQAVLKMLNLALDPGRYKGNYQEFCDALSQLYTEQKQDTARYYKNAVGFSFTPDLPERELYKNRLRDLYRSSRSSTIRSAIAALLKQNNFRIIRE